jgi:hypothetical protein
LISAKPIAGEQECSVRWFLAPASRSPARGQSRPLATQNDGPETTHVSRKRALPVAADEHPVSGGEDLVQNVVDGRTVVGATLSLNVRFLDRLAGRPLAHMGRDLPSTFSKNERLLLYRGIRQAQFLLLRFNPFSVRCAVCQMRPTGLVLLFEVGTWPPHDGIRKMRWFNLIGALANICGRICRRYELTSPIVPVRTSFCRSRTR